jgi:hypothetical protein
MPVASFSVLENRTDNYSVHVVFIAVHNAVTICGAAEKEPL